MSRELPILCNDTVALNIRNRLQTQHRVPMRKQPPEGVKPSQPCEYMGVRKYESGGYIPLDSYGCYDLNGSDWLASFPWKVGDLLYVREACRAQITHTGLYIVYRADNDWSYNFHFPKASPVANRFIKRKGWTGNQIMPKFAARTWVRVKRVWIEQIQDISEKDAKKEGVKPEWVDPMIESYLDGFQHFWNSIYGSPKPGKPDHSWGANPWVWCCEFERVERE